MDETLQQLRELIDRYDEIMKALDPERTERPDIDGRIREMLKGAAMDTFTGERSSEDLNLVRSNGGDVAQIQGVIDAGLRICKDL